MVMALFAIVGAVQAFQYELFQMHGWAKLWAVVAVASGLITLATLDKQDGHTALLGLYSVLATVSFLSAYHNAYKQNFQTSINIALVTAVVSFVVVIWYTVTSFPRHKIDT